MTVSLTLAPLVGQKLAEIPKIASGNWLNVALRRHTQSLDQLRKVDTV